MFDMLYTQFAKQKKKKLHSPGTRIHHAIPVEILIAHAPAYIQSYNDKRVTDNHMLHTFHCAKKCLWTSQTTGLGKSAFHREDVINGQWQHYTSNMQVWEILKFKAHRTKYQWCATRMSSEDMIWIQTIKCFQSIKINKRIKAVNDSPPLSAARLQIKCCITGRVSFTAPLTIPTVSTSHNTLVVPCKQEWHFSPCRLCDANKGLSAS